MVSTRRRKCVCNIYYTHQVLRHLLHYDRMANGCFKDAADLHAQIDQFGQAIARYEQVADQSLNSNLTRYSVKEYWLRSGLCALANQVRI